MISTIEQAFQALSIARILDIPFHHALAIVVVSDRQVARLFLFR